MSFSWMYNSPPVVSHPSSRPYHQLLKCSLSLPSGNSQATTNSSVIVYHPSAADPAPRTFTRPLTIAAMNFPGYAYCTWCFQRGETCIASSSTINDTLLNPVMQKGLPDVVRRQVNTHSRPTTPTTPTKVASTENPRARRSFNSATTLVPGMVITPPSLSEPGEPSLFLHFSSDPRVTYYEPKQRWWLRACGERLDGSGLEWMGRFRPSREDERKFSKPTSWWKTAPTTFPASHELIRFRGEDNTIPMRRGWSGSKRKGKAREVEPAARPDGWRGLRHWASEKIEDSVVGRKVMGKVKETWGSVRRRKGGAAEAVRVETSAGVEDVL